MRKAINWALEFDPFGGSLAEPPRSGCLHQRISRKAMTLLQDGLSRSAIATELGVSRATVIKAIAFARGGGDPDGARPLGEQLHEDILRLRAKGWSLQQIGDELGVSRETARKVVRKVEKSTRRRRQR